MSASKAKGTRFETLITDWLRSALLDNAIERRALSGKNDKGDIAGVRTSGGATVAVECKNHNRLELAEWIKEAEREAVNAHAAAGVVIHKRKGVGVPSGQYVTMTLDTFAWLLAGGPE